MRDWGMKIAVYIICIGLGVGLISTVCSFFISARDAESRAITWQDKAIAAQDEAHRFWKLWYSLSEKVEKSKSAKTNQKGVTGTDFEIVGPQKQKVKTPTIVDAVPKVVPGVVHVMCPKWQGSGFVVGPRLIVTARHVVEGVNDFVITTYDGHKLHATRAISFKEHDIGFIWIDDLKCISEVDREIECAKVKHEVKLHILEVGSIKECKLGQTVFAIGSPYGKLNFNFLSSGIVSALNTDWNDIDDRYDYGWEVGWTTTAAGHPGNSGCPIFTLDGKVRGVLVGGLSNTLIIAMPVDLFLDHLDEVTTMFEMDKFQVEEKSQTYDVEYSYHSGM